MITFQIELYLGQVVKMPIKKTKRSKPVMTLVRLVDGEKVFNDAGISCGFVHFADPETGMKLGWAGATWAYEHMVIPSQPT